MPQRLSQFIVFTSSKILSCFFRGPRDFLIRIFHPTKNRQCFFVGSRSHLCCILPCHESQRSLEVNAPRLRGEVGELSWRRSDFFVARVGNKKENCAWWCVIICVVDLLSIDVCWYIILSKCTYHKLHVYYCVYMHIFIYV